MFFEVSTPSEVRCLERGSCYRVNCQKQWSGTHFKPSPPNIIIPLSVVTITWPARFGGAVPCKGIQLMSFAFGNRNVWQINQLTIREQLSFTAAITPYYNIIISVWIHINFIKGEKSASKNWRINRIQPCWVSAGVKSWIFSVFF